MEQGGAKDGGQPGRLLVWLPGHAAPSHSEPALRPQRPAVRLGIRSRPAGSHSLQVCSAAGLLHSCPDRDGPGELGAVNDTLDTKH